MSCTMDAECDDGNECTDTACDPSTSMCSSAQAPNGMICGAGYCADGECTTGAPFPCTEDGVIDAASTAAGEAFGACLTPR